MSPISRGFLGHRPQADAARVPPGQYRTRDFPVLSAGPTPHTPLDEWTFLIIKGYVQAGLLSLVIFLSGVPTRSYNAEGNIVGGVFASRRRAPRGRRTCACTESPDARTGRSHDHPPVVMEGRVVRERLRP